MAEFDIYGDGTTIIDVEYQLFLQLLARFASFCYNLAEGFIVDHVSGLADFDNKHFKLDMERARKQYSVAVEGIDDGQLKIEITELMNLLEMLNEKDHKIRTAYREILEENGDRSNNRKLSLEKRVYRHLYQDRRHSPAIVLQIAKKPRIFFLN